jgi:hypothetical protein
MRLEARQDMTILSSLGRLTWLLRIKVPAFRKLDGFATSRAAGNARGGPVVMAPIGGHARDGIRFRAEFTWRLCAPAGTSQPGKCAERFAVRPRLPGAAGEGRCGGSRLPGRSGRTLSSITPVPTAVRPSRLERVSRRALEADRLELRLGSLTPFTAGIRWCLEGSIHAQVPRSPRTRRVSPQCR